MKLKKTFIWLIIITILAVSGVYVYNVCTKKAAAYMIKTVSESLTEQEFETVLKSYVEAIANDPNATETERKAAEQILSGEKEMPQKNGLDLKELEKKLTPEDRAFVMDVYKRFSKGEISEATALVKDGITPEEKQILKEMLKSKLVSGEKEKVVNIYSKYIINE